MIARGPTENLRRRSGQPVLAILSLALISGPAFAQSAFPETVKWSLSGILAALLAALVIWLVIKSRRNSAENALVASVFRALPHPAAILSRDGAVLHVNAGWSRLAGSAEDGLAALWSRLAKIEAGARNTIELGIAAGHDAECDLVAMDAENKRTHWHLSVRVMPSQPGKMLCLLTPDAGRTGLADAITGEQERFEQLLEGSAIGYYSADSTGRLLYVNDVFAGWIGMNREILLSGEIRLRELIDLGPQEAGRPPIVWSALGSRDGEHGTNSGEVVFFGANGNRFTAMVMETALGGGELFRTRSLVRNLSAEESQANVVRAVERRFSRMFDNAPVSIAMLDDQGVITECSPGFSAVIGLDAKLAIGQPLTRMAAESQQDDLRRWVEAGLKGANPEPMEFSVAGGGEPATLFSRSLGAAQDEKPSLIIHAVDESEQRSLQEQFIQSQKMELVGKLAGGIAHDFNNLLTAIIGFCDLLLQRHSPKDPSFADIQQIKQNGARAANLVRQLLAFSRQQALQPKILNVTDVLAELSHLLRRLIGANIKLEITHARDLWLVKVDEGQLEQVIINLAVNARDAMGEGGQLTISTRNLAASEWETLPRTHAELPPADYVVLEVSDTGVGIPEEFLAQVFEPFFTTKEVGAGTGLGLSTVYGIVKQTGGHVFVDSSPNEGAHFSIYLPRAIRSDQPATEGGMAEEAAPPPAPDLTGAGTVLLVEDEDAVRMFGSRALRNKGYHVVEASSGEEALSILESGTEKIDVLVTDVVMPGLDGPSLIRQVRETRPDMRVIFISGYTEDSFRERLDDGSMEIQFLSKPFTLEQLAGKVKEILAEEARSAAAE